VNNHIPKQFVLIGFGFMVLFQLYRGESVLLVVETGENHRPDANH
jgi:hypothetical protein